MIARPGLLITLALTLLHCTPEERLRDTPAEDSKTRVRNFWTTFRLANQARVDGDMDAAIAGYREALLIEPAHEEALFYLGVSLEHTGRYGEAATVYEELLGGNPNSGRALSQLAELLLTPAPGRQPDFERAGTLLHRLLEVNREQTGPFLLLGRLALNRGDWVAASENFLVAGRSGAQEGYAWAGYTAILRGDRRGALDYLERPLETQRRESEMAGSGIRAEGDVLPAPDKPLSALDRAALMAKFLLQAIQQAGAGEPGSFEPLAAGVSPDGKGAWGDFNRDGRPGIAVGGKRLTLYGNTAGSFRDITREAGLAGVENVSELVWLDYDSDGWPDLYLSGGQGVRLFRNLHDGRFEDGAAEAKLAGQRNVLRALPVDIDGDGDTGLLEAGSTGDGSRPVRLYRNDAGIFSPVSIPPLDDAATVTDAAAADFDGDGRMDLALAVWKRPVRIFLQRDKLGWEETEPAPAAGEAVSLVPFDYDRDGATDLLIANHAPWEDSLRSWLQPTFQPGRAAPLLLRNTGGGAFEDASGLVGLASAHGVMQAIAADFDGDGWADLLLANGGLDACRLEPSVILRNEAGKRFSLWQRLPAGDGISNVSSAAVADFDGDGAPDIFLGSNRRLPASVTSGGILRNRSRNQARR